MASFVYLINNAESETSSSSRDYIGGRNLLAKLTPKGIIQAKALGKRLMFERVIFSQIYCSKAERTKQTAGLSLNELNHAKGDLANNYLNYEDIIFNIALEEIYQGDWEGISKKQVYKRKDVIEGLNKDCWNFIPGDQVKGESQAMVAQRMRSFLEKIIKKSYNEKIAVFTHTYPIKYLLAELFNFDKTTAYKIPLNYGSITIIKFKNENWDLVIQNDISFL